LWPTANANGGTGYMSGSKRDLWRPTLESAVQIAPEGPPPLIRKRAQETMFPTLCTQEFGCKNVERMLERRQECKTKKKNGNGFGLTLSQYLNMLPTLTARDGRSGKNKSCFYNSRPLSEVVGGLLNPTWCEWFMGFPAGWTELEDSATPSSPR
jgi:hypothetical protein